MRTIPLSRFRRELNSLLKQLKDDSDLVIMVTRNNKQVFVLISTKQYEELNNDLPLLNNSTISSLLCIHYSEQLAK